MMLCLNPIRSTTMHLDQRLIVQISLINHVYRTAVRIPLSSDLKRELLRLLEEDEEFRYAVAGRIGILEILKRLDRLEEGQNRLWEEVRDMRVTLNRIVVTLDRLTISVEEEDLSFVRQRIKTT